MRSLSFKFSLYVFLLFAVLGQIFWAQRENAWTLVPALLFWGLALYGLKGILVGPAGVENNGISPLWEGLVFATILAVGAGFRIFRIDVFPCGVSVDQASTGLGGLKILGGWRPFFETPPFQMPLVVYYPVAAWFKLFPPTQTALAFFSVVISLCSFPAIYWTFRQLSGSGPALFALAFLSFARWDAYLGRWDNVNLMPVFFAYTVLFFWLRGLATGRVHAYLAAGFFLALGLYGYYSFWIFPFLLAGLAIWEARHNPRTARRDRTAWAGLFLVFAAVASPLLWHWLHDPHFGLSHPREEFVGGEILAHKSLMPLVENVFKFLEMFSREGDPSPKQTFDSAPMLDGVTGTLAVLGLAMAFFKPKERSSAYPLVLFAGFSLNNILSTSPANILHVLPLLPCVVYWAGSALWRLARLGRGELKPWYYGGVGLAFLSAAALNYQQLFDVQARGKDNPAVFDLGPTLVGKKIAAEGSRYDFLLRPNFGKNWIVQFLGYRHQDDFRNWDWPRDPTLSMVCPGKKGACFVMGEGDQGMFNFLRSLYPGGQAQIVKDGRGDLLFYALRVSREDLIAGQGLRGILTGRKPVNVTSFPKGLPGGALAGRFSGNLFIRQSGLQYFWAGKGDQVSWSIDGRTFADRKPVFLIRGFHTLELGLRTRDASRLRLFTRGPDGQDVELDSSLLSTRPLARGLEADYFQPQAGGETLVYRQWDPLVNFTHRTDLALFNPPLSIRWSGKIWIGKEGSYDFLALTEPADRAQVTLDGKALTPPGPVPSGLVTLGKGWHSIQLDFQMGMAYASAISLAWKKPGNEKYEIIPPQVFGFIGGAEKAVPFPFNPSEKPVSANSL